MTDLTKDKIKAILVTLLVIFLDICGVVGLIMLWTYALPEVVVVFGSLILIFFMSIWTYIGWTGLSSSNLFKKK